MPDKLTNSEIVKALEKWIKNYDGSYVNFKTLGNALDLINRLQAENKRLSTLAELGEIRANDYRVMRDRALKVKAENERLKLELADTKRDLQIVLDNSISAKLPHCVLCGKGAILTKSLKEYDELISDISAEAYKEFAERVKIRFAGTISCNYEAIKQAVDNLLKEMCG